MRDKKQNEEILCFIHERYLFSHVMRTHKTTVGLGIVIKPEELGGYLKEGKVQPHILAEKGMKFVKDWVRLDRPMDQQ
ncbi:MAG: hypothetical protein KAJ03_00705 [Gammaproteobacteria bacterium]|nr:hypothetical protein [Gammaproteobacteria bacterium]